MSFKKKSTKHDLPDSDRNYYILKQISAYRTG